MNEELKIRVGISEGFYLDRIVRTDKAAYMEHLTDPEISWNTLAIPYPFTETDADQWLEQCEKQACEPEKEIKNLYMGMSAQSFLALFQPTTPTAKQPQNGAIRESHRGDRLSMAETGRPLRLRFLRLFNPSNRTNANS